MDDARTWGIDANLSYKILADLSFTSAYSYLDTKAHLYDASKDRMTEVIIDGTAHHKWSASLIYGHAFSSLYKLGISLSTRGSSRRYYQNNGNGDPFQIWRINTTHDFGRTGRLLTYRVEFGIDNIFNYVDRTMRPYHLGTNTSGTTVHASFCIRFNYGKRQKSNNNLLTPKNSDYEED